MSDAHPNDKTTYVIAFDEDGFGGSTTADTPSAAMKIVEGLKADGRTKHVKVTKVVSTDFLNWTKE